MKLRVEQFCLNTGLHGYKFIVLPKRILLERVVWFLAVAGSSITAALLVVFSQRKFESHPTTLVTDTIHYPIWNYPFPAVTVCSFNRISRINALQYAQNVSATIKNKNIQKFAEELSLLSQLYYSNKLGEERKENLPEVLQHLDSSSELYLDQLLRNISPSCESILKQCKWKEEERRCDSLFEKIITSEGHCCSFNYLAPKFHKFTGSHPRKSKHSPQHVSACGFQTSLEVIIDTPVDDYFTNDSMVYGNKVMIHSSYDYPDWSLQSYLVGMKIMALIGVNPTITNALPDVKSLSVDKRVCYFSNELVLKNFAQYSYQNCLTECRLNLSIQYCGCVPVIYVNFYDPKPPLHRICTIRDMECLHRYKDAVKSSVPGMDIRTENISTDFHSQQDHYPCRCLPDCDFVHYVFEASQGILNRNYANDNQKNLYGGVKLENHSVLRVYFNDLVGTRNRREVLYNWQTYLAFYGGILGFFVGFSFISLIELIFFFSVKLFVEIWNGYLQNKVKNENKSRNGSIPTLSKSLQNREMKRNFDHRRRFLH